MADLLRRKPDALLGVATGSAPLPVYQALAAPAGRRMFRSEQKTGHNSSTPSLS
jgi:6-phosphogluconolactonase/glucosamine-6-phosphate isomerase/deaminase